MGNSEWYSAQTESDFKNQFKQFGSNTHSVRSRNHISKFSQPLSLVWNSFIGGIQARFLISATGKLSPLHYFQCNDPTDSRAMWDYHGYRVTLRIYWNRQFSSTCYESNPLWCPLRPQRLKFPQRSCEQSFNSWIHDLRKYLVCDPYEFYLQ